MQPVTGPAQIASITASDSSKTDSRRIEKSSRDFESLLLSNWLEKAYDSLGTVPGAEEDGELDSGKDQLSSIAMQSLAQSITASGGIGIAKLIANHLRSHTEDDAAAPHAVDRLQQLQRFSAPQAELSPHSGR